MAAASHGRRYSSQQLLQRNEYSTKLMMKVWIPSDLVKMTSSSMIASMTKAEAMQNRIVNCLCPLPIQMIVNSNPRMAFCGYRHLSTELADVLGLTTSFTDQLDQQEVRKTNL